MVREQREDLDSNSSFYLLGDTGQKIVFQVGLKIS